MTQHSFVSTITIGEEQLKKVDGLLDLLDSDERKEIRGHECAHGCNYTRLFGKAFWVDFSKKHIQHDTRNTPCDGPGGSSKAPDTKAAAGTQATPMASHTRVDVPASLSSLVMDSPSLGGGATYRHDESTMREIPEGKRLMLMSSEEMTPERLVDHVHRLVTIINAHQTSMAVGIAAVAREKREEKVRHVRVQAGVMVRSADDSKDLSLRATLTNIAVLGLVSLGLIEWHDYVSYVAYSNIYKRVKATDLLRTVHESVLPDLAKVREALDSHAPVTTELDAKLDGNIFLVLGTLARKKDRSGLAAFYRHERSRRLDVLAKKLGWKPTTSSTSTATGGSDAIKADTKSTILGKRDRAERGKTDTRRKGDTKRNPRKRGRRTGRGTNTRDSSARDRRDSRKADASDSESG